MTVGRWPRSMSLGPMTGPRFTPDPVDRGPALLDTADAVKGGGNLVAT